MNHFYLGKYTEKLQLTENKASEESKNNTETD